MDAKPRKPRRDNKVKEKPKGVPKMKKYKFDRPNVKKKKR